MIQISREESLYLRKVAPGVTQVVVNKHAPARKKSRMIPEDGWILKMLDAFRKANYPVVEFYPKGGKRRG